MAITQARTEALSDDQIAYINSQNNPKILIINVSGDYSFNGDLGNLSIPDQDEADTYIADSESMTDAQVNGIGGATNRPARGRGSFNT